MRCALMRHYHGLRHKRQESDTDLGVYVFCSEEMTRPAAAWRPPAPSRGQPPPDTPHTAVTESPGGPSWRATPQADSQVGGAGVLSLSPLTPEPSATVIGDRAEGKGEGGSFSPVAVAPQKRRREGEDQPQATHTAEETPGSGKRSVLPPDVATTTVGHPTDVHAEWLATEEAKAPPAPDSLVDEVLRSRGLVEKYVAVTLGLKAINTALEHLSQSRYTSSHPAVIKSLAWLSVSLHVCIHRVTEMTATELMQLDQQQRQQVLSLRKALRARKAFC